MVKRAKSPEPVEDSKFFTVVHPFPLNANMEVPNDFKEFMFWLATVVGKDYALGVYHKPSARGMVVAEISKFFEEFDKLLGEHSWNRFLRRSSAEEMERKSCIYFSTYSSARALHKDGWKNILADDELFREFRPINKKIQHPYPVPVWCDVPYEDPTNKRVCRPIPVQTKAPPLKPPVPVPGSAGWTSQKVGGKLPIEQKAGGSKGGTKNPVNPNAWKTPIIPLTSSKSASTSTSSFTSSVISPRSASTQPPISFPMAMDSTTTSTPHSINPTSTVASTEYSVPAPPPPAISHSHTSPSPGLVPSYTVSSKPMNPAGSSSITMLQTQFAGASISDHSSVIASPSSNTVYDLDEDSEDDFVFPLASEVASVNDLESIVSGDGPRMGKGPGRGRFSLGNVTNPRRNEKQDHSDNTWTKVPKTTARTFSKIVEAKDVCPDHGTLCSKGICTVMKRRKREQEQELKRVERAAKQTKQTKQTWRRKPKQGGDGEGERNNSENDDDDDDAKTEVGDDVRSIYSSRASAGVTSNSGKSLTDANTRSRGGPTSVAGSVVSSIRGDWGPRRKRNARQRAQSHPPSETATFDATFNSNVPEDSFSVSDRLETIAVSSARPTYGGEGSTVAFTANSVISYDGDDNDDDDDDDAMSVATLSVHGSTPPLPATPYSAGSMMKPTLTRTSIAPVSALPSSSSPSSYTPSAASSLSVATPSARVVNVGSNQSKGLKSAKLNGNGINVKGKGRTNSTPQVLQQQRQQQRRRWEVDVKGKDKQQQNMNGGDGITLHDDGRKKTWDEMVEEGDSELGSIEF